MSKKATQDWTDLNIVDDVAFDKQEAEDFRALLGDTPANAPSSPSGESPENRILNGRIVEITKDHVVVDVGLKSEGVIEIDEFADPNDITLDAEVEVYLESSEDENGQIVLSREKAERQRQWENIVANCEEGSIVRGRITRKVKGGLMVDIGMEAFLPGSQIDNRRIKNLDDYIGQTFDFKILKINIDRKNVVVSRRELLEAERLSKRAELLETIHEGDRREGIVKNITDFGVFLDLDGLDGLLHITDMTWKRIRHPSEMVDLGDKLEVVILNVDKEKGRVALGLKQKDPNPWEEIETRYPPGTRVKGQITNLLPYGAFIEIEDGIEGLIHVSEMSWTKTVKDPSEVVQKGDDVEAIVLSVHKEEGKISLGLKQAEHNPWNEVANRYPVESKVSAQVVSLTNYGAFVELEPGVEGLIHVSDISWLRKISHPSEVLNIGDKVDAVILEVDPENRHIKLGMKQLTENPWEHIETTMPVGSTVSGKVIKITAFGAFVELDNGIEGLIHVTELSDQSFGKVEEVVAVNDRVTVSVVKIDPEHKKIALSLKGHNGEGAGASDDIVVTPNASADSEDAAEGSEESAD